ncbi:conserved hypothetical protein [Frankia sp. AiPs1]|uniref:hypothetical protein n=1 Tax=Frankia sp. AiPa1 TaxID=573492 RepID=UPI00202AD562|nr:hypothetical protein [Frankia sp. AiPa1]MCL9762184.1 hypothetical protein [Frankia sp. AiPa1]
MLTSSASLRVLRFVQSIHMRRSTMALIVFFLVTAAAYLWVRPTPTHVAQTHELVRTTTTDDDTTTETVTTPRHATRPSATPTPAVSATPTPVPSLTPTPTGTAIPPSATATPSADPGLLGSFGASPSPGAPGVGSGLGGAGQATQSAPTQP